MPDSSVGLKWFHRGWPSHRNRRVGQGRIVGLIRDQIVEAGGD
jgi:hypothetical protein